MLYMDKGKLETILGLRGISLNLLAEKCGISRQSIYNMFEDIPVFNTTFEKIRKYLNIDYRVITSDSTLAQEIIKSAPDRIKIASYVLVNAAEELEADLLSFNSHGINKFGPRIDWNFAIYFRKKDMHERLSKLRQDLSEKVSPYSIEIINLNRAPLWLKLVIKSCYIRFYGNTPEELLFKNN